MNATVANDIRGVLISVTGGKLLLPNASVAEVITYSDPEPVTDAPSWVLGRVRWRGWALPIMSYSRLVGWSQEAAALGAKVAVLKAIGGHVKMPYFAVLTQGFPRLTTLNAELIIPTHDGSALPPGVRAHVLVRDDVAMIPDLEWLEAELLGLLNEAELAAPTDSRASVGVPEPFEAED